MVANRTQRVFVVKNMDLGGNGRRHQSRGVQPEGLQGTRGANAFKVKAAPRIGSVSLSQKYVFCSIPFDD